MNNKTRRFVKPEREDPGCGLQSANPNAIRHQSRSSDQVCVDVRLDDAVAKCQLAE
jgi:hypothetical protein